MEFVWSKGRFVIFCLMLTLSINLLIKNNQFKKQYAEVIENKDGKYDSHFDMGTMPPMIPATYLVSTPLGPTEMTYYVPTLQHTPEWQDIQQLRIIVVFLMALCTPKVKNPKKFWKGVKKKLDEQGERDRNE